jgi:putative endonuclease
MWGRVKSRIGGLSPAPDARPADPPGHSTPLPPTLASGMAAHNEFGARAEVVAASLLEAAGWRILHRNWRFRHKELDLVARRGGVVAFVEVRARRPGPHGHPLETVSARKRRDVAAAAQAWIGRYGRAGDSYRFDVIALVTPPGALPLAADAVHTEDAWRL